MAVLTGLFLNLGSLVDVDSVGVGTPNSTTFTIRNATLGFQWIFSGAGFSGFVGGIPSTGTITEIRATGPTTSASLTGASVSVPGAVLLLNADDVIGLEALIFEAADTITGTEFDDGLSGYAGDDSISGGAGSDGIRGEGGRDSLFGEGGDDRINGGVDNDLIDGGDGRDYLLGGSGADTLFGGLGDDTLVRFTSDGPGADVLDGGAGLDRAEFGVTGSAGVTVNAADLATATGATFADGLVIRNIEGAAFSGGAGADTFIISGPTFSNGGSFSGGGGVDTFVANLGSSTTALSFNAPGPFSVSTFLGYSIFNDVEVFRVTTGSGEDRLFGGAAGDFFSAGAGNDEIFGGGGNDTIDGGAGDDSLDAGGSDGASDNDSVRGGAGNDTINGGDGANRLFGDDGDDFIRGIAADLIDGGAGIDQVSFNFSTSTTNIAIVNTGSGFTAAGVTLNVSNIEYVSEITTGSGDDRFTVNGPFRNIFFRFDGGSGFDVFVSDYSDVSIDMETSIFDVRIAGAFNGASLTNIEAINLKTGAGNDSLDGGDVDDTLDGGAGNDRFGAIRGRDSISGGEGDDTVEAVSGAATLDGGAGVDHITLDASGTTTGQSYDLAALTATPEFMFLGATVRNFEQFSLIAGAGNDTFNFNDVSSGGLVDGSEGFDTLNIDLSMSDIPIVAFSGSIGLQFMSANALSYRGVETVLVLGGSQSDSLDGGVTSSSTFQIRGGAGADLLVGGAANDTLYGETDLDDLDGGRGNDVVDGGAETDNLAGGDGDDLLLGGDGNDRLVWDAGRDTLDGGAGVDVAEYRESQFALNINLSNRTVFSGGTLVGGFYVGGALEDVIIGIERVVSSEFADRIVTSNSGSEIDAGGGADRISGLNGDDTIFGNEGDDTIEGGGAEDLLFGFFGDDSISGGQSSDTINGGEGRDTLDGGTAFDTIDYSDKGGGVNVNVINGVALTGGFINSAGFYQGGTQEDVISNFENIIGSFFSDRLIAGSTSARIDGGQGNDLLFTFSGNDTLLGGSGNDFLSSGKSTDGLFGDIGEDTLNGGTGFDTLDGGAQDDTADYSDRTGGVNVDLRNGTAITGGTLGASGNYSGGFTEDRLVSIENVFGSNFGDRLTGLSAGSNLEGRDGADRIIGVGGNDTIDGGAGNDTLTGGGAADLFVFNGTFGADRITDFSGLFSGGRDVIVLSGLGPAFDSFDEVIAAASQSGANVVFNFGGGNTITVQNATLSNFAASDIFITS